MAGIYVYLDEIIKGKCLLVADMHLKYEERVILVSYQEYSELAKSSVDNKRILINEENSETNNV